MMFIHKIGKSKIGPTARPFYITRSSMLNSDILYATSSGQMTGHVTFPSDCQRNRRDTSLVSGIKLSHYFMKFLNV